MTSLAMIAGMLPMALGLGQSGEQSAPLGKAVVGGLALGLVESLGTWQIPTEWQSTIAFVVLFLVLLFKPRGLFARGAR